MISLLPLLTLPTHQSSMKSGHSRTSFTWRGNAPGKGNSHLHQASRLTFFKGELDAVWLFIREKSKSTVEEQEELFHIRSASVTIETAYGLVQQFLTMVRKRQGEWLDIWIEAVQASQIPELGRFVNGILQDRDAVVAGLTEVYSNGQTEGQVHKLKLVKRSMYGRAKLPLLRQRLLNAF